MIVIEMLNRLHCHETGNYILAIRKKKANNVNPKLRCKSNE